MLSLRRKLAVPTIGCERERHPLSSTQKVPRTFWPLRVQPALPQLPHAPQEPCLDLESTSQHPHRECERIVLLPLPPPWTPAPHSLSIPDRHPASNRGQQTPSGIETALSAQANDRGLLRGG